MNTYVTWFLMLMPPAGHPGKPVYISAHRDAVQCQLQVIARRETEPGKLYECRKVQAPVDLSRPPKE